MKAKDLLEHYDFQYLAPHVRETVIRALRLLAAAEDNDGTGKYSWECNECGSQEYTMSVSEDDVQNLGCGNCGGQEWHKARSKP